MAWFAGFPFRLGVVDPDLEKLARYRRSKSGKTGKNAARDFHRYIRNDKKMFPVEISSQVLPIRKKKPNKSGRRIIVERFVHYPIITLSSWIKQILLHCAQFFLGGFSLDQHQEYEDMFEHFWDSYSASVEHHPVLARPRHERRRFIPIAIHGDEGRGLAKVPLLVIAYQAVIPHNGPNALNIKKPPGSLS